MKEAEYKILLNEVRALRTDLQGVRDEVGEIDKQVNKDRLRDEDVFLKLDRVIDILESLKRVVNASSENVKTKVENAVTPAINAVADLKEEIKNKKTITVKGKFNLLELFKIR